MMRQTLHSWAKSKDMNRSHGKSENDRNGNAVLNIECKNGNTHPGGGVSARTSGA